MVVEAKYFLAQRERISHVGFAKCLMDPKYLIFDILKFVPFFLGLQGEIEFVPDGLCQTWY